MRRLSLLSAIIFALSALAGVAPVGAADLGPAYNAPLIAPAFKWNCWLFDGTGGFAWSDDAFTRTQITAVAGSPPLGDVRTNSPARTGWAAGGGIEYGFARNWTARVEYLHLDLSDQTFSFTAPNNI